MSNFYQAGIPSGFQFQDGLKNALIRQFPNVTSSSTVLNTLFVSTIPQGLFSSIQQLKVDISGQFIGALGTKRLVVQFGGGSLPFLYDSGAITQNNSDYFGTIILTELTSTQYISEALFQFQPTGAITPVTLHKQRTQQTIAVGSGDMSFARAFTIFNQVGNAGDSISLISIIASIL